MEKKTFLLVCCVAALIVMSSLCVAMSTQIIYLKIQENGLKSMVAAYADMALANNVMINKCNECVNVLGNYTKSSNANNS